MRKKQVIAYILSVLMVLGVFSAITPLNLQADAGSDNTAAEYGSITNFSTENDANNDTDDEEDEDGDYEDEDYEDNDDEDEDEDENDQNENDQNENQTTRTYTLTLRARRGGTVAIGTGSYGSSRTADFEAGARVTISARASRDYYFDEWTYNWGETTHPFRSETTFIMPNRNVTVWAEFEYSWDWRRDDWRRDDWRGRDWTPATPQTVAPTVPPPAVATPQENIPTVPGIQLANQQTWLRLNIGSPVYTLNGQSRTADVAPFIDPVFNRTMVPLRTISEALGVQIDWVPELQMVVLNIDGTLRGLAINEPLPGGMGTAMIVNDRTFVPVSFVAQIFGAGVHWDGVNRAVYVMQ